MEIRKRKYKFVSFCLALIMLLNITPLSVLADAIRHSIPNLQERAQINPGEYLYDHGMYTFIFRLVILDDFTVIERTDVGDTTSKEYDPSITGDGYQVPSPEYIFDDFFSADKNENYWYILNSNTDQNTVELIVPLKGSIATEKEYDGDEKVPGNSIFKFTSSTDTDPKPVEINPENVVIPESEAKFKNKNVGTDKPVTGVKFILDENLTIPAEDIISGSIKGTITPKAVTVSDVTAKDKEYDGNADAELNVTVNGIINNEEVSAAATGTFVDKTVDTSKTVNISGWHLTGSDDDKKNYTLSNENLPMEAHADITPKEVTISGITAKDKPYDGTTAATLDDSQMTITGIIDGDDLSADATRGEFGDKNVGTNKNVNLDITLTGADSGNYKLGKNPAVTASITPKAVTVSGIEAQNKTYDGRTDATLVHDNEKIDGVINNEKVSAAATGKFTDKAVGTGKTVELSELTLTGDDSGNYTLAADGQQTETTAAITPKAVTVSGITANDKQYDGSRDATLVYSKVEIAGKVDSDDLSAEAVGTFDTAEVGENKTVNLSELQLTGNDKGNYELAKEGQQLTTTASITEKEIFRVDVKVFPENSGTAAAEPASGPEGKPITLTAAPGTGYRFVRWDGLDTTDNPYAFNLTENITVTAVFEKDESSTDPDQPDNPDNPDNPDQPDNPDNPDNPDQPNNPDNPDNPDQPNNPDNPDNPDQPVNPDPVDPGEKIKLPVKFQHYNQNGEHGVPADAKAGTWDLTLEVSSADGGTLKTNTKMEVDPKTAAEGKFTKAFFYFTKDIDLTKSKELTVSPKEVEADIYSAETAPVKVYTIQIESVSVDSNNELNVLVKWSDKNANGNEGSGKNEEDIIRVVALPEDEIGAYKLLADGTKEYLLFHTYAICMEWLGNAELCSGYERCFHK